jgi:excisionase family DNA binding protein
MTELAENLNDKLVYTIEEVIALTSIKRDLLYDQINCGHLRSVKIGGRRLVRREAIEDWLLEQEEETMRRY